MEVTISNNIRIKGAPAKLVQKLMELHTIDNPVYVKNKARKLPTWGLAKKIYLYTTEADTINLGRGALDLVSATIESFGINNFTFVDNRFINKEINFGNFQNMTLRDYQSTVIDVLVDAKYGILDAPAGSGKTIMGLEIMRRIKQPTLWLVHTEELINQTAAKARKVIENVGKIGFLYGTEKDFGDGRLIIASVRTLANRPELIEMLNKYIGCVILDEAHHAPASTFLEVVTQLKGHYVYGLTATPYRADGLEPMMLAALGPVRKTITRQELYDLGFLIKPSVVPVYTQFAYSQASLKSEENAVNAGGDRFDYHLLLESLMADEERKNLICSNIVDNIKLNNYQLVLGDNKQYLYKLYNTVIAMWNLLNPSLIGKLNAVVLTSDIKKSDRVDIMQRFYDRKLNVVFATQLAREGLDIEHLNIVHITTPRKGDVYTKFENQLGNILEQEVGRVMRPDTKNPYKKSIIYDYVDYETNVLKSQWRSRCMVYARLLLSVPRKAKSKDTEAIEDFLRTHKIGK